MIIDNISLPLQKNVCPETAVSGHTYKLQR